MTLTTHIRIVEPTQVKTIFDECRRLLGGEHAEWIEQNGYLAGNREYRNRSGQGLPALMWVEWGADGLLREYEDVTNSLKDADEDHLYHPAASIAIGFDTAYGYRGENGAGCADLHAWLLVELGRWLDARSLTWYWQNEFTGDWFKRLDDRASLLAFGDPSKGQLRKVPEGVN